MKIKMTLIWVEWNDGLKMGTVKKEMNGKTWYKEMLDQQQQNEIPKVRRKIPRWP